MSIAREAILSLALPGFNMQVLGGNLTISTTQDGIGGGGGASAFTELTGNIALTQLPTHPGTTAGQVLQTTTAANGWELGESGTSFSGLANGDIVAVDADNDPIAATQDQVLTLAGLTGTGTADTRITARVAAQLATTSIDALADVDTTTNAPTDGQALTFIAASNEWRPLAISGSTTNTTVNVSSSTTIGYRSETISGVDYRAKLYELNDGGTITFFYNARRRNVDDTADDAFAVDLVAANRAAAIAAFDALDLTTITYT